jgi:hypothetical protein
VGGQNKHPKNFVKSMKGKRNKQKKNKTKGQSSGKGKKPFKCHRYSGPNHIIKKCNIPQHLIGLYQKSLKEVRKAKGSYQAHFNATSNEATTSGKCPDEDAKTNLTVKYYIDRENMIIEYDSNGVFGDQD